MPEGQQKATILFAEDEGQVRGLFEQVFKLNGFEVMTAVDGKEALQLAERYEGRIDLLISNVQMPEMTGPDLARELRKSRPQIKIILVSGSPQGVLLLDQGWIFLHKPVSPSDLITQIEDVLGRPPSPQTDRGGESGFPKPE